MKPAFIQNPAIRRFITDHRLHDVRELALKKWGDADWPRPIILDQIAALQTMAHKIPTWVAHPRCVWPGAAWREQASSEATALHKASLFSNVTDFVDLTGGVGVDAWALARTGALGIVYERDPVAAAILVHNMEALVPGRIAVRCADSYAWLQSGDTADLVLIDPARRTQTRKGSFLLEHMDPPILEWVPALRGRAGVILIKLSPMLDLDDAARRLSPLADLIVVEWRGQCREILVRIDENAYTPDQPPRLHAVMIDDDGMPVHAWVGPMHARRAQTAPISDPMGIIAEPAPAWQKAGLVDRLAMETGFGRLHPNTHVLTGDCLPAAFPGRLFGLCAVVPATRAAIKPYVPAGCADITVRNFPITADALRAQLGLGDGGDVTLFAVTLQSGAHRLLVCKKL